MTGPPASPRLVVVVARLDDEKLDSKLAPLLGLSEVSELRLVRRSPLARPGIRNHCPPAWMRGWLPLTEAWRLATVLLLAWRLPRDSFWVAFYLVPHGLYIELARRLFGLRTIQVLLSQKDLDVALSRPLLLAALRAAHAVGVRGTHSAERLEAHGLDPRRVFIPPNLYAPSAYAPGTPQEQDIDVAYVGSLVPVKRLDILISALAQVKAGRPRLRAVIVGDGPLGTRLQGLAAERGLSENLTFAGRSEAAEVASWLRRSRVFVLTSEVEGLPMAMIEALSCGVPVVVPDVGDVTTVARHGENAWIVSPPTASEFAKALARLLDDEPLREHLRRGALAMRGRFEKEYSLEAARAEWQRALAPSVA